MTRRRLAFLSAVLLLLPGIGVLLRRYPASAPPLPRDNPQHVHLTFQGSPTGTVTVTWQTRTASAGDTVWYDVVPRGGDATRQPSVRPPLWGSGRIG